MSDLTSREGAIVKTINDINRDFEERNFAGVIREIALRPVKTGDQLMLLLLRIKEFADENQYNMGEMELFATESRQEVNAKAVKYLLVFMKGLLDDPNRKQLLVADTFKLEFRIKENDNDTGWVEKIANVGSDGTDILVNSYAPIDATLNGMSFMVSPMEGSAVFVNDADGFEIPSDVTVVGMENAENFMQIRRQKALFDTILPESRLLFVCRYPQNTAADLRSWLLRISNPYVHFGDFDLAGVHIYLSEFYAYLGERSSFLIPPDIDERLSRGNSALYNQQYAKFRDMKVTDVRLRPLVNMIHRYRKGYEQEGYIDIVKAK